MKQLSSMMVGEACRGSSTPPMPTPPARCAFLPICAQEPTVAQVSTITPSSMNAPMLVNEDISTTLGATKAPLRTTAPGAARSSARANAARSQPANFVSTLS